MKAQPKKITITAHGLRAGGGVSVGKNLILELTKIFSRTQFQIFIPDGLDYESYIYADAPHTLIKYQPMKNKFGRFIFDKFLVTKEIEKFSPDIILCLGNIGVKKKISPQILLIQDSHLFYPSKYYSRETKTQKLICVLRRIQLYFDLKNTYSLLCQTKTAATRIKEKYRFPGGVHLIPNAISIDSLSGENSTTAPEKISLLKDSTFNIFYLTRYYAHKNIEIFIELFTKYREQLKNVTLYLTIEQHQHPNAKKLIETISELNLGDNIVNLGPIKQQEIAGYFKHMQAMVMPTTLESFSGSYLEAMAFGCPILTSDLDFAREVCGDAALYFDPWSVDSLYNTIRKIIGNQEIATTLTKKGRETLASNTRTWEQNARALAEIISAAVNSRHENVNDKA